MVEFPHTPVGSQLDNPFNWEHLKGTLDNINDSLDTINTTLTSLDSRLDALEAAIPFESFIVSASSVLTLTTTDTLIPSVTYTTVGGPYHWLLYGVVDIQNTAGGWSLAWARLYVNSTFNSPYEARSNEAATRVTVPQIWYRTNVAAGVTFELRGAKSINAGTAQIQNDHTRLMGVGLPLSP